MVPVSVTVKTVVLNVAPAYPDGADLTQTTAKNVDLIRKYFKIQLIIFNTKVIRLILKVSILILWHDMTSFSKHIFSL